MRELRVVSVTVNNYKHHVVVYNDASKTANGVDSVFVIQGASYSWALTRTANVYTAAVICRLADSSVF